MRTQIFQSDALVGVLQKLKIAMMDDLKGALGTRVDMTVFRKLRDVKYCSSYSHRGKYYALLSVAKFNKRGLWTCQDIHFSRFGSLIDTAEHFVSESPGGYLASELSEELLVQTREPLLNLVREKRLVRETVCSQHLYCSLDSDKKRQQVLTRRLAASDHPLAVLRGSSSEASDETRAALILFFSMLNERQRRVYAGLESIRFGKGGDRAVSSLVGMDVHTVARGRKELLNGDVDVSRLRRPGGGRPAVEKKLQA
jgi:hypothetical protein